MSASSAQAELRVTKALQVGWSRAGDAHWSLAKAVALLNLAFEQLTAALEQRLIDGIKSKNVKRVMSLLDAGRS